MTEPIKLANLKPHLKNSEMWGELDVANLVESIKETNRITPILVSHREDGSFVVLGGHRRLKAANELEWEEIDCEVHFGLTEQQEEDLMFLDNAANRIMDGDIRLKAAMCLLRGKTGTQKQATEKLAKLMGIKFDAAQKVIQTAKSINDSLNQIESQEERNATETEVLRVAKRNGARSPIVKKAAGIIGASENKKSRGITAKSSETKMDTVHSPQDGEVARLRKEVALFSSQLRPLQMLRDSLPHDWHLFVQFLDNPVDLAQLKACVAATPVSFKKDFHTNNAYIEDYKDANGEHPPQIDRLYDYFNVYFQGQLIDRPIKTDQQDPNFSV
jgi:hypothetical protein